MNFVLQKWRPGARVLVASQVGTEDVVSTTFRVPIPDSRLRVKISVIFVFKAGTQPVNPDLSSGGATLWLAETEDDDSGMSGTTIASTNIEGTEAAPTVIPQAVGLAGYSREFITAADNIEGRFSTSYNGFVGNWILQLRYQPDNGQHFTNEEWREICGQAKPIVPPPVNLT
jgi:hypothetical protein